MPNTQTWAADNRIKVLVGLVLALAAIALGTYSYYTWKQAGYIAGGMNSISVSGKGEIFAKPDIATFSFSVDANGKDSAEAQKKSTDVMNAIVAYLKDSKVEDKDVKTSGYNLSPKYRFDQGICTQFGGCPNGKQILEGYTVSQTVEVKVRDTAKAGDLLSGVGSKGATNISGLTFTIDDINKLKRDARELAIKDAKANAEKLAHDLGIKLGRIQSYYENEGGVPPMPMMYNKAMSADAGGMARAEAITPPDIPTGENTIRSNVSIVYELR